MYNYIYFNIILHHSVLIWEKSRQYGLMYRCCSGISSHLTDLLIFGQIFIAAVHARDVMRPGEPLRALQVTRGHSNHLPFVKENDINETFVIMYKFIQIYIFQ